MTTKYTYQSVNVLIMCEVCCQRAIYFQGKFIRNRNKILWLSFQQLSLCIICHRYQNCLKVFQLLGRNQFAKPVSGSILKPVSVSWYK